MDHVSKKDQTPVTYGKSKLKYPLRSSTKSTIEKPSSTNLSNSLSVKRDKPSSSISRSVGKQSVAKQPPPRRFSIATKPANPSVAMSVGSVTPIYEKGRGMFSSYNSSQGKGIAPGLDSAAKSLNRRKFNLLSSSSYWVSQIKLFESANKHSISLGLFKLALEAEVVSFHKKQLKEELKSYVRRHNNLTTHEGLVRDLFKSYEIEETHERVEQMMDDGDTPIATGSSNFSKSMKPKSINITRASSHRLESEKKTTRMGTPVGSSVREAPTPKHESSVIGTDKKAEENKENILVS